MKIRLIIFNSSVFGWLLLSLNLYAQIASNNIWQADLNKGKYQNPILYADYSDPDICKVGDDFYMTSSSFNCVPALPILHSKDLVNWRIINYAIPHFPDEYYNKVQHGNGVWAPSIRHHQGWFYIFWGDPDRGIYMVKTKDPESAWSTPILIKKAAGNIDPCPLWDDDGKVYMVHAFANSRAGVSDVLQVQELSPEDMSVTRNRKIVIVGYPENFTLEGPKFYKRNGYYYIFAPAGGVAEGWQMVFRADNPFGPYEGRKVLEQGNSPINGPHQGGYVELDNGECWFVHFQEKLPYGRIVHLQPMSWENDWPIIGYHPSEMAVGMPVTMHSKPNIKYKGPKFELPLSDEFNQDQFHLGWQWQANPHNSWYAMNERPGYLRLYSQYHSQTSKNVWEQPNLLLQKIPGPSFSAQTCFDVSQLLQGERAGFIMMGMDYAALNLENVGEGKSKLKLVRNYKAHKGNLEEVLLSKVLDKQTIWLSMQMKEGGTTTFSYSIDGKNFNPIIGDFTAEEGRWIGAKIGLFSQKNSYTGPVGYVDVDFFRINNFE
ncbi:glycoside hydrolase 43 family protein [Persicobacter diffluens]|uniref:Glycoside hydrolase n=1 Tax=Persicobacter diffluens TaxID=981 RepID=A0AAN5ALQ7_9BACT|nr:glycoside hydrolase [Persicobacter diffluens]